MLHSLWEKAVSCKRLSRLPEPVAYPGEGSTSSPGRFSLALGAGREKALASAGHMTTKHPVFVGVIN